jgi:hypothetical protein
MWLTLSVYNRPWSSNLGTFSWPILLSKCRNNGASLAKLHCLRYPTYSETRKGGVRTQMSRIEQTLNKPIVVLVVGVIAVALNVLLYFGYFLPRTTPLVEQIYSIGTSLPEAISKADSETGSKADPEAGNNSNSETGSKSDFEASSTSGTSGPETIGTLVAEESLESVSASSSASTSASTSASSSASAPGSPSGSAAASPPPPQQSSSPSEISASQQSSPPPPEASPPPPEASPPPPEASPPREGSPVQVQY